MAVKIVKSNLSKTYDKASTFETTCPYCNSVFTYQGYDLKKHRRFKNGYIRCPVCKKPIGHEKGSQIEVYEKNKDFVPLTRKQINSELAKIEKYKLIRTLFIIFGIVFLVLSVVLIGVLSTSQEVYMYSPYMMMLGMLGTIGLGLLIVNAAVFGTLIKKSRTRVYDSESYYKNNKEEE